MSKNGVVSVNSINWARIVAQISYYIWAALQLDPTAQAPVAFVVPTGAFGNALSGYIAKLMGVHIGGIVCATNANDIVHRTISRGDMCIGPNVQTLSPAMDIQVNAPSRLSPALARSRTRDICWGAGWPIAPMVVLVAGSCPLSTHTLHLYDAPPLAGLQLGAPPLLCHLRRYGGRPPVHDHFLRPRDRPC
eukprot:scaffold325519_cov54-Tisochrysis_lutea.AAC.3